MRTRNAPPKADSDPEPYNDASLPFGLASRLARPSAGSGSRTIVEARGGPRKGCTEDAQAAFGLALAHYTQDSQVKLELLTEGQAQATPVCVSVGPHVTLAMLRAAMSEARASRQPTATAYANAPAFSLSLHIEPGIEDTRITLHYADARLDKATAEALLSHTLECLTFIAESSEDTRLSAMPPLLGEPYRKLVEEVNETSRSFPDAMCLHQFFERQAETYPDHIALRSAAGTLTFFELEARANQLARCLRACGVGPGDRVALCLPRGFELVTAMLSVLKASASYVPLDPNHPKSRSQFILEDTNCKLVLTWRGEGQPFLQDLGKPRLDLWSDRARIDAASTAPLAQAATAQAEAYVLYTSGSTGTPKGVIVQHRAAVNLVDFVNRTFQVSPADRLLFVTSVCFDLSVYDVFGALGAGASLYVASSEELRDPQRLASILESERITFWDSAPAMLSQVAAVFKGHKTHSYALRLIFLSGDWIPVSLAQTLKTSLPKSRLVALGGATEATIWSNYFEVEQVEPHWPSIPYGKPIQNARYYVLDPSMRPLPAGVAGELYIAGTCLAVGYLNRPELTQKHFVEHPSLGRLYRTYDRARFQHDGHLEFLGRLDSQVKIRGFRVELGEIETLLQRHPGVLACVVDAPFRDFPHERNLVAYVVRQIPSLDESSLREACLRALPDYMIPSRFVFLEGFPLTAHGKLDRRALSKSEAPQHRNEARITSAVEQPQQPSRLPRSDIELALYQLFAKHLQHRAFDVSDDFFEKGGHSLRALHMMRELNQVFAVDLPVGVLFQTPTVRGLCQIILEHGGKLRSKTISLHPGSKSPPLFFICGIQLYRKLAENLVDQPSFGVYVEEEQRFFESADRAPASPLQGLATAYVEAILEQHPRGPLSLAGASFGGLLAFEAARQLTHRGREVSLLVLLDSILPNAVRPGRLSHVQRALRLLRETPLEALGARAARHIEAWRREAPGRLELPPQERLWRALHSEGARAYLAERPHYRGRTLLIRAADPGARTHNAAGPYLGWAPYLTGPLRIEDAAGSHLGILGSREAAAWISEALAAPVRSAG